jgi:hypothetical protein
MKRAMRNLAIGLVLAAFPLAAILIAMRLRSRFAISWVHAGVLAMLSVPAALIGRWLVAASFFAVGLIVMGILVLLDRRDLSGEDRVATSERMAERSSCG